MTIPELEELINISQNDYKFLQKNSKGRFGVFNRRDAHIVKNRMSFIKQIHQHKKKDPSYIPDIHK